MSSALLTLALLACPVGMGVMMWMMRSRGTSDGAGGGEEQVAQLRAEIEQLKAERTARTRDGDH